MSQILHQLNTEVADIADRVRASLVQVRSGGRGGGAGTVWHSDGLILTNAHVVEREPVQVVLPQGDTLPARVVAQDKKLDIAALAVDATNLTTIEIGESRRLRPGQVVLALGHPWGVMGSVSAGVVIGLSSERPEMEGSRREMIAVSLSLRPGNSGGPLVDAHGRLLGITSMMTGPEVGLAVPVHVVKAFLRENLGSQQAAD